MRPIISVDSISMRYEYHESQTSAKHILTINEPLYPKGFLREISSDMLKILWNQGESRKIIIDEIAYNFPASHFLALMGHQNFQLSNNESIVSWGFNRDFYCIIDHDEEVSCAGFLFYGGMGISFIQPSEAEIRKFGALLDVFKDEFETRDNIQGEMLQMLLKRLIIKLTRLARDQQLSQPMKTEEFDVVRRFNLLVEQHFQSLHQVKDYADLMNKSPKTLSNLFYLYNEKSPIQIIRERIAMEARKRLRHTEKSISEIAYELGFHETAHFSRFFKKMSGVPPKKFQEMATSQTKGTIDK